MPYIGSISSSLYLEVFSFKLRAAWSDRPENYISGVQKHNKHNLHVYILYINVIISYSFKEKTSMWMDDGRHLY